MLNVHGSTWNPIRIQTWMLGPGDMAEPGALRSSPRLKMKPKSIFTELSDSNNPAVSDEVEDATYRQPLPVPKEDESPQRRMAYSQEVESRHLSKKWSTWSWMRSKARKGELHPRRNWHVVGLLVPRAVEVLDLGLVLSAIPERLDVDARG